MAVATLPILGAYTLPPPVEQGFTAQYRGGTLVMASGKIVHDLVDTTPRYRFNLRWIYLTASQLSTVNNAWNVIKNTTATYTTITGGSYTVTRPEGGELEIEPVVTAGGDIKFNVTMELVEDS